MKLLPQQSTDCWESQGRRRHRWWLRSRYPTPQPRSYLIINRTKRTSGVSPNFRVGVAIKARSFEAVGIVEQKKNTLMALWTAKQRMLSAKSVARIITSLSYVEAVTKPEKEVQVEVEDAPNPEVEVTKVDKLNLRVRSGYAGLLSIMWLRTLNQHLWWLMYRVVRKSPIDFALLLQGYESSDKLFFGSKFFNDIKN